MATTSLGRLTVDMAVDMRNFDDGMTRAERETARRTQAMSRSVRSFRDQLTDSLSGTQVGNAFASINSRFESLRGNSLAVKATLAGMAVGGIAVATGALVKMAIETAKADAQLEILANRAKVSLKNFQILQHASEQLGIEQDQLGSILADVQEKLGEYSATGAGGAVDFFEALQNNTKMTDSEIRKLSKTLQNMDGADAIQHLKNKLDELGASSQEQRFIFESLAGDLGNLLPLFENGGKLLDNYGKALQEAGVIKTKEAIKQSRLLSAQTKAMQTRWQGVKTQLAMQVIPAVNQMMTAFSRSAKSGGVLSNSLKMVAGVAKYVVIGVTTIASAINQIVLGVKLLGLQVVAVAKMTSNVYNADGISAKLQALKNGYKDMVSIKQTIFYEMDQEWKSLNNSVLTMVDKQLGKMDNLTSAYYGTSGILQQQNTFLKKNTVDIEKQAKAEQEKAKALKEQAKSHKAIAQVRYSQTLSSRKVNPRKYVKYVNQGATRNRKLDKTLERKIAQVLSKYGVTFKVISGGQGAIGTTRRRVGTTAHDNGHAGDGDLYKNGRKLRFDRDRKLLSKIIADLVANGVNGIGGANNYMGNGRLHLGIQKRSSAWGAKGKGINAPQWLKKAHARGRKLLTATTKLVSAQATTVNSLSDRIKNDNSNIMRVYKAFRNAGLSDNQARIITAEVGREGSFLNKNLFGTHGDKANKKTNIGMISWQGSRKTNLIKYMRKHGLMDGINSFKKTQKSLNAQAIFAVREMKTIKRYRKTKHRFLNNPNVSYKQGARVLGTNYIQWRYNDRRYRKGHRNRDDFYKKINKKLGNKDYFKKEYKQAKKRESRIDALYANRDQRLQYTQNKEQSIAKKERQIRQKQFDKRINQLNQQKNIFLEYSKEEERISIQTQDKIARIKSAGFSKEKEAKRIAFVKKQAEQQVFLLRQANEQKIKDLTAFNQTKRDLLIQQRNDERQAIKFDPQLDNEQKQRAYRAIDIKFDYEMRKLKLTEKAKLQSDYAYRQTAIARILNQYEIEKQQIQLNASLTPEQKQQYTLALVAKSDFDIAELQKSAMGAYENLRSELFGTNELDSLKSQQQAEMQVIQEAIDAQVISVREANNTKLALDRKYYEAKRQLITGQMQGIASSLTQATGDLVGKQSKAYRVMFAIEKGFAIARSIMAIQTGIAQASSLPFPANLPAMASVVASTASIISNIQAVRQPVGQAHDGIENVPREGTWILDKGERVVKPKDNNKLTKFLDIQDKLGNKNNSKIDVTIINNTPVTVTTQNDNGKLKVFINDYLNRQLPSDLANPNSNVSKSLKNNFGLMPAR